MFIFFVTKSSAKQPLIDGWVSSAPSTYAFWFNELMIKGWDKREEKHGLFDFNEDIIIEL